MSNRELEAIKILKKRKDTSGGKFTYGAVPGELVIIGGGRACGKSFAIRQAEELTREVAEVLDEDFI